MQISSLRNLTCPTRAPVQARHGCPMIFCRSFEAIFARACVPSMRRCDSVTSSTTWRLAVGKIFLWQIFKEPCSWLKEAHEEPNPFASILFPIWNLRLVRCCIQAWWEGCTYGWKQVDRNYGCCMVHRRVPWNEVSMRLFTLAGFVFYLRCEYVRYGINDIRGF